MSFGGTPRRRIAPAASKARSASSWATISVSQDMQHPPGSLGPDERADESDRRRLDDGGRYERNLVAQSMDRVHEVDHGDDPAADLDAVRHPEG